MPWLKTKDVLWTSTSVKNTTKSPSYATAVKMATNLSDLKLAFKRLKAVYNMALMAALNAKINFLPKMEYAWQGTVKNLMALSAVNVKKASGNKLGSVYLTLAKYSTEWAGSAKDATPVIILNTSMMIRTTQVQWHQRVLQKIAVIQTRKPISVSCVSRTLFLKMELACFLTALEITLINAKNALKDGAETRQEVAS